MNLSLYPTWRASNPDQDGAFVGEDIVQLETRTKRPRSWNDHLAAHSAIRELLLIAAWYPFGFSRLWVHRGDDPETVASGKPVGDRWAEAVTYRLRKHKAWDREPKFLFRLADLPAGAVSRWIKLRSTYERALQPLVALGDETQGFLEARMVQSGIALEALGHQIGVAQGRSPNSQTKYSTALNRVLGELAYNPIDATDWKSRSIDCYRGVKHADRAVPDSLIMLNTLRENLLVLRLWVASRLGVAARDLRSRVPRDPLASEYVLLD